MGPGSFQIVKDLQYAPRRCIVYPHVGYGATRGFIDTGTELPDVADLNNPFGEIGANQPTRAYVSIEAAEAMARFLGWVPPADHERAVVEAAAKQAEIDRLNDELREADKALEAVDTLARRGFQPRAAA